MKLKRLCCTAFIAAALAAMAPQAYALRDVSIWAQNEVWKAAAAGVEPTSFSALNARSDVTRAEFCAVAVRLYESGTNKAARVTDEDPFTDTDDIHVVIASSLGLVSGRGDGTFDPDAFVTRQELCVMLGNVRRVVSGENGNLSASGLSAYSDADKVASWAAKDMADMVSAKVISGTSLANGTTLLAPTDTASREQAVIMAMRFLENCGLREAYGVTGTDDKTTSIITPVQPGEAPPSSEDPELSADPKDDENWDTWQPDPDDYPSVDDEPQSAKPVSSKVTAYRPTIQKYAAQYGISDYVRLIEAVMMQESGGEGTDPMQAGSCGYNTLYPRRTNAIPDPEYSIDCGVHELADCLKAAGVQSPTDMQNIRMALQGYNYGSGYIRWAKRNYGTYSAENAKEFSENMKEQLGVRIYGDPQYIPHVLRYYPYQ